MIMHTYSASGTYVIKYLGIEKDPATGFICFEKILKDTIKLQCSYTCCKNYSAFVQAVDAATTITIDSNACKVTLNIGNLPCSDYLEWVDWGDGNQIYGPFTSGSMIMHTYSAIGTFIVTYLAIEKNPVTGLICFEKILKDTISLQCKNVGTYLTLDNDKNVFIYPNPASDDFNIIWSEELSSIDNVIIVDIMGKKLKNQAIVRNTNIAKLSVSSISEGFYMVQVYSSGKLIAVKKLIKN
jgi:hypothetical protein